VTPLRESPAEASAKRIILRELKQGPASPEKLLESGHSAAAPVPYSAIRSAMWVLVGDGAVRVTRDWRFELVHRKAGAAK
jgi:hypothetical protein